MAMGRKMKGKASREVVKCKQCDKPAISKYADRVLDRLVGLLGKEEA